LTEKEKYAEKELIIRAKKGDDSAFEEIVKLYEKKICQTILFMVKNDSVVEDVAQEVFIKIYKNISKFNEQSSLYTWIYRITINACYDEIRKEKKVVYLSTFVENENGEEQEIDFEDSSQNVAEIVEKEATKTELIDAIKKLPEDARALIVLRDIREFTYWEIADMLKLKLGTVKSKINRARKQLRDELKRQGYNYYIDEEDWYGTKARLSMSNIYNKWKEGPIWKI